MNNFGLKTRSIVNWSTTQPLNSRKYTCGFCNILVSSSKGYRAGSTKLTIHICPECNAPTLYDILDQQFPSSVSVGVFKNLPTEVDKLFNEIKSSYSVNSYTPVVLCCRKLLMHIGVDVGAEVGKSFFYYVEYLFDNGYIPPNAKGWVDYIRTKGNEANHEIVIMEKDDATQLINFMSFLLNIIYELASQIPKTD